mgnify:CR=1 FL=1
MNFALADHRHRVFDEPKRMALVGDFIRRKGPVRVREVAMAKGAEERSIELTLRALETRGQALLADGCWSWTGGALLIRAEDLTENTRRVVTWLGSQSGNTGLAGEVSEGTGIARDRVIDAFLVLESWSWVAREVKTVATKRQVRATLTEAACAEVARVAGRAA